MRWSIRYQLLVPLLTLLLGVVGISTWTAVASVDRAEQQIESQVRNVAHTLSEANYPLNQKVLEHMKRLSGAEYVLASGAGRVATFPADTGDLPLPEAVADDWQTLHLGPRVSLSGQAFLGSGLRLRQPGHTLYILYPEALWRDALWEAVRPSLVLGSFVGVASIILAVGVGRRLSRRIQELGRRTRLIAGGDFSPMPLPGRDDELRDLGQSVNEMAQRLAQFQETVQRTERLRLLGQVSGGLAHQLRNGVTGARLAVQLHARECAGKTDPETLDVALRQLNLLEANLKRFLDLGRAERANREPCSLTHAVSEAVALLRPQCRHAHIELRWQPPVTDGAILGDAGQLGHLVLNVIGNAVEAAGPGGWVEIRMQKTAGWRQVNGEGCLLPSAFCLLEIVDSGPGPSAEIAERLFEPFVTGKPEGVGLGLAVARQVVEAHGGSIAWRREAGQTCFRIEFPLV